MATFLVDAPESPCANYSGTPPQSDVLADVIRITLSTPGASATVDLPLAQLAEVLKPIAHVLLVLLAEEAAPTERTAILKALRWALPSQRAGSDEQLTDYIVKMFPASYLLWPETPHLIAHGDDYLTLDQWQREVQYQLKSGSQRQPTRQAAYAEGDGRVVTGSAAYFRIRSTLISDLAENLVREEVKDAQMQRRDSSTWRWPRTA